MQKSIKVNDDIRLIQLRDSKRQALFFLHLLKKNKKHLCPYFPFLYAENLTLSYTQELLKNKEIAFKRDGSLNYAICSRKNKKIIGEFYVSYMFRRTEVGYWIDKDFEKQGIMSCVFDCVRDMLFTRYTSAIYASCDKKNSNSILFLKTKGLKKEIEYSATHHRTFIDFCQTRNDYLLQKKLLKSQNERSY